MEGLIVSLYDVSLACEHTAEADGNAISFLMCLTINQSISQTYTLFQYVNVSKWIVYDSSSEDHEYLHKMGGLAAADNDADMPRSLLLESMKV